MAEYYCKYTRESSIEMYSPECCTDWDPAFAMLLSRDVHPSDMDEWEYCPWCGKTIEAES
jgi:hypothetical protein